MEQDSRFEEKSKFPFISTIGTNSKLERSTVNKLYKQLLLSKIHKSIYYYEHEESPEKDDGARNLYDKEFFENILQSELKDEKNAEHEKIEVYTIRKLNPYVFDKGWLSIFCLTPYYLNLTDSSFELQHSDNVLILRIGGSEDAATIHKIPQQEINGYRIKVEMALEKYAKYYRNSQEVLVKIDSLRETLKEEIRLKESQWDMTKEELKEERLRLKQLRIQISENMGRKIVAELTDDVEKLSRGESEDPEEIANNNQLDDEITETLKDIDEKIEMLTKEMQSIIESLKTEHSIICEDICTEENLIHYFNPDILKKFAIIDAFYPDNIDEDEVPKRRMSI